MAEEGNGENESEKSLEEYGDEFETGEAERPPNAWEAFIVMVESKNFPAILDFFKETRDKLLAYRERGTLSLTRQVVWIQGILLFLSLGLIAWFGYSGIIEKQALVVLLTAYIGYLWGARKNHC